VLAAFILPSPFIDFILDRLFMSSSPHFTTSVKKKQVLICLGQGKNMKILRVSREGTGATARQFGPLHH
jgi:hypothetical protein